MFIVLKKCFYTCLVLDNLSFYCVEHTYYLPFLLCIVIVATVDTFNLLVHILDVVFCAHSIEYLTICVLFPCIISYYLVAVYIEGNCYIEIEHLSLTYLYTFIKTLHFEYESKYINIRMEY